LGAVGKVF